MDCKNTSAKLQELLDGVLSAQEAAAVRRHLDACASCGRVFQQLSAVGRAVAALPIRQPSPALRANILAAWAGQRRRAAWSAWVSAPALALVSSGLAAGVLVLGRVLSLQRLLDFWALLSEPSRAVGLLKLELARSAFLVCRLCSEAVSWLPGLPAFLPLQLAAGMLLAGAIVTFAARGTLRPALSSHWRSS